MKFPLLSIIAFLTVVLVATHAVLPSEIYWKSMLANTPMPELLKDLPHLTVSDGNSSGATTNRSGRGWYETMSTCCYECSKNNYFYNYRNTYNCCIHTNMNQLLHNSNTTMYFLEKDLNAGRKMNLHFNTQTSIINNASFLPRQVVKSIPFSSSKMDEILNKFTVERGSVVAKVMKDKINICDVISQKLPCIKNPVKFPARQ